MNVSAILEKSKEAVTPGATMKAVVFHGIGDIRLDEVPVPKIKDPTDAVIRLTASAICGTDLHLVRGTMPGMVPGTIIGHEGVGIIEETGSQVRNLKPGDRVVITSTIACGYCSYCRAGYYSQCDNANPNGKLAGAAFFGGPKMSGPYNGLQAERARIPFANVCAYKLPREITDDQAILMSDIFPTGYFGAELAEIHTGDIVAVFGCGPVGQFAIASAIVMGAGRVIAVDQVPARLEMARAQGAEVIDFSKDHPVKTILEMTGGIGVDRAIDAVGVDAQRARSGPAARIPEAQSKEYDEELKKVAPETHPDGENWKPGDAPSQAVSWAAEALDKAGTLAVIGVYPQTMMSFPLGLAMNKNLRINLGNCNHRAYLPRLTELVLSGVVDPSKIITKVESFTSAIEAYKAFDKRASDWIKVKLQP